jgi:hypothetical protein
MRKLILLASAAAMAVAMPSLALGGQGKGGGKGGGQAQTEARGGGGHQGHGGNGNGRSNHGSEARQHQQHAVAGNGRGGGHARQEQRAERPARQMDRAERNVERAERRAERDVRRAERRPERSFERADRNIERAERRALRTEQRMVRDVERNQLRGQDRARFVQDDPRNSDRFNSWREGRPMRVAAFNNGCPPGLAKQNAFCLPPGQLRRGQMIGQRSPFANLGYNIPQDYRYRFQDGDGFFHRYGDDGHVYRVNQQTGLIESIFPLMATNLLVGEPLPLGYDVYNVPTQYRSIYQDNDDYRYRYDDDAIYRVNNNSGLIEGIVALLTGGGLGGLGGLGDLGVGQMLPSGYDAYNVPLDYRDQYVDDQDSMYRYADGNIYQVDPQTRLIETVISLLT